MKMYECVGALRTYDVFCVYGRASGVLLVCFDFAFTVQ